MVLLLLIIGIGSALKAPSTSSSDQTATGEKSIDLAGNATDQANGVQPAPGTTSAENTQQDVSLPPISSTPTQGVQPAPGTTSAENTQQDVSLPPISSTPTQGQIPAATDGQQRVEVQGDLNNALTQPQNQQQLNNVAVNSTLPTEPATVAPLFAMAMHRVTRRKRKPLNVRPLRARLVSRR